MVSSEISVIVAQPTGQNACPCGVCDPFVHALGVAQRGEPFKQADEAFAFAPVTLAKGVAQVLAAGLRTLVGGSGFANREHQVPQG